MGGPRLTTENTERDILRMKDEISSGIPIIFPWTLGKKLISWLALKYYELGVFASSLKTTCVNNFT